MCIVYSTSHHCTDGVRTTQRCSRTTYVAVTTPVLTSLCLAGPVKQAEPYFTAEQWDEWGRLDVGEEAGHR
jgi:hypothetical protein